MSIEIILEKITALALVAGPKILLALITLVVGLYIISWIVKLLNKAFEKTDFDESLEGFIASFVSVGLKVILLVSVAGMLGLETTTLIAMLGAMAFAVGMALQGSLANFAGGVLLLVFKPFKVGDYIEAQGHAGTVEEIQIFQTTLKTPDNKKIIIPNGDLSNGSIVNYSTASTRRVNLVFGIGYNDDLKKAKEILTNIVKEESKVLKDPEPQIVVGNLGDNAVEIYCRIWVKSDDYWDVNFSMTEKVKLTFDKEDISFPFPQRDVHFIKG